MADDTLKEYKSKTKAAFIIVVHSLLPVKRLGHLGINILNGDAPTVPSNATKTENTYPSLDWSYFAINNFCQKCLIIDEWFDEKISFSNYAGIPLGNFNGDTIIQIIDVLFSRALQNNKSLLWYSDSNLPDLGGNEDADFRRFLYDQLDSNIEISKPGFYRSYCVEIDLSFL